MILLVLRALALACCGHQELVLENIALRHQLRALKRTVRRPRLRTRDRTLWILLANTWRHWRTALVLVQPDTVLRWHREWLRRRWARRSRRRRDGRPTVDHEIRALVSEIATTNPLWGAPRMHGELCELGLDISERTVSRLLARRRRPPSQAWRTFLTNHLATMVSMDFFTVSTLTGRVLFVWSSVPRVTARGAFNVTEHPTATWTAAGRRWVSRRQGATLVAQRSRQHLQRGVPSPRGGHGDRGSCLQSSESLAQGAGKTG